MFPRLDYHPDGDPRLGRDPSRRHLRCDPRRRCGVRPRAGGYPAGQEWSGLLHPAIVPPTDTESQWRGCGITPSWPPSRDQDSLGRCLRRLR
uniref:Uncharacterized protein n=1 Tax=Triticum urartu TaxID=4572 RepID=A0A8R7JX45_TRIUA